MNKKKLMFHSVGIGLVVSAIGFQLFVYLLIWFNGIFIGFENNRVILVIEMLLTVFAIAYFIYICIQEVK